MAGSCLSLMKSWAKKVMHQVTPFADEKTVRDDFGQLGFDRKRRVRAEKVLQSRHQAHELELKLVSHHVLMEVLEGKLSQEVKRFCEVGKRQENHSRYIVEALVVL